MDFLFIQIPKRKIFWKMIDEETLRIGRFNTNQLILEDPFVSRFHAKIVRCFDGYQIFPLGKKSKTFVNDQRITESTLLHPGDRIRMGKTCLVFNSSLPSPVEFIDRPIPLDADTTSFPIENILTPPPGGILSDLHSNPLSETGGEINEAREAILPFISKSSISPLSSKAALPIMEADRELVFNRPLPEILEKIMDLVHQVIYFERGVLAILNKGELVPQVARMPSEEVGKPISLSGTIANRVLKNQESILTSDALADKRFRMEKSVRTQHLRSVMCVPLWNQRKVIGLIYVDNPYLPNQFKQQDLLVLTHLAIVVAAKIEHQRLFARAITAKTLEKDLQTAAEIQKHLLPEGPPSIPGYLLHASSLPCRTVGGDAFDFLPLQEDRFAITLGDVAGKGLPAAMLMCTFQATVRALVTLNLSPEQTMTRLNRLMFSRIPMNRFVTFFFAILDPNSHSLTYVNAGHDPPFLIRDRSVADTLPATEGPIGSFDEIPYRTRSIQFQPGDLLFCYSDGATDSRNSAGEFFGKERLFNILFDTGEKDPIDIIHKIEDEIEKHHADAPQEDDITLLVLKRNP